jgi:BirA family biotin operon repressor/biotin-[acetyl-CoA-carboxylase] ligase
LSDGAARVLEALRKADDTPCSGEQLSSELGVSRAQIWKHVSTLRGRGYEIDGERGGGYRLTSGPDRLYPEEIKHGLETRWLGREIHYFDTVDSTNRIAQELAQGGCVAGTAVVAEAQTAGRGRLGRSFHSPAQQNLYTSIVLRPRVAIDQAPTLILAAGIAVAEVVSGLLPDPSVLEIKWPNDVLLAGRKTSGILMELGVEETRVSYAIVGIGVNLNIAQDDFPEALRPIATSVSAHAGQPIDRVGFTRNLYATLEDVFDAHEAAGLEALRPRFDAHFEMSGREVAVQELAGEPIRGTATGVAQNGALEVTLPSGETIRVIAGDVTLTP